MKKTKQVLVSMLFLLMSVVLNAQVSNNKQVKKDSVINPKSYWQISARGGYDMPSLNEDFKYLDYKGGLTTGISLNKYWSWYGVQLDFDYITNSVGKNIDELYSLAPILVKPAKSFTAFSNSGDFPLNLSEQSTKLTRMFLGAGPAFKYQNPQNNFTAEIALMAGMSFVKGGEILVNGDGVDTQGRNYKTLVAYHSGFENQSIFTGKLQTRFNYFFNDNFGVHLGAYYMNYFKSLTESRGNDILRSSYPGVYNENFGLYLAEIETTNYNVGGNTVLGFQRTPRFNQRGFGDNLTDGSRTYDLSSIGVFTGITVKFPKKVKKEPKEEPKECFECQKFGLTVVAKDKLSSEVLEGVEVVVKDSLNVIVKSGTTNSFGTVTFDDIKPKNYTIEGKLNSVDLEGTTVKKEEFKPNETIEKEIFYTNKDFIIKGKTLLCDSDKPLADVTVYLENKDKNYKKQVITGSNGKFMIALPKDGVYNLYGKKDDYFSQIEKIDTSELLRNKNLYVQLEICLQKVECNATIKLENILYNLDKYDIREDAKPELDKLVRFMKDNPKVIVELGSHTDARGSHAYNQRLSQNRAKSAVNYIISQGVERSRITAKGYGETILLNECKDGVKCSEDKHQLNRRTEFKVVCKEK